MLIAVDLVAQLVLVSMGMHSLMELVTGTVCTFHLARHVGSLPNGCMLAAVPDQTGSSH